MKQGLNKIDSGIVAVIARVRGLRAETAIKFPNFRELSIDTMRKRLERLCNSGYLARCPLPSGQMLFRLSHKGVRVTGSPASWAVSPSPGIAAEMLSVSCCAAESQTYVFPTPSEFQLLARRLLSAEDGARLSGRYALRTAKIADDSGKETSEAHLHHWLAEIRTPAELAKRVETVATKLRSSPSLLPLIETKVFGITVAVPSSGVKESLEQKNFSIETSIIVVDALKDLIH